MKKLDIIEIVKWGKYLRRSFFILAIIFPLFASINKISTRVDSVFIIYPFLIFFFLWLVSTYFIKSYKIIGTVIFYDDNLVVTIPENKIYNKYCFDNGCQIVVHLNDTANENYGGLFFGVGALRTKEGTNNFIEIEKNSYQILIQNEKEKKLIKHYFDSLSKNSVNVVFV